MIAPIIRRLAKARAVAAKLEKSFVEELASLPKAYGFNSQAEFIAALETAGRGRRRPARRAKKPSRPKARKRAVVTRSARAKVKAPKKAPPKDRRRKAPGMPSAAPKAHRKRLAPTKPAVPEPKAAPTAVPPPASPAA